MPESQFNLCPTQQLAFDDLASAWHANRVLHLWSRNGLGRSRVLEALGKRFDAPRLSLREFVAAQRSRHPLSIEDTLAELIERRWVDGTSLVLDDLHLLKQVGCYSSPRSGYLEVIGKAIVDLAGQREGQLLIGSNGDLPRPLDRVAYDHAMSDLTPEDYRSVGESFGVADRIDVEEVHRFAPRLTLYQLRDAWENAASSEAADTESFLEYLRSCELASNVELSEVDAVGLRDLVGMESLIDRLESDVVFPLEDDARACRYGLRPKRGVLLLGPPGTGKTTIGKALAHRLRGKFFLIDGTVISGTSEFYEHVSHIFEMAQENSPSVIFVDDSDVIFENGREHGLYRYLLTMLDGLESQSAGRVCVIMTAMDIRHMPPALIRSGRVELWLETGLPERSARHAMIEKLVSQADRIELGLDIDKFADATAGCTPADLKRLVNEAKVRYAWIEKSGDQPPSLTECGLAAMGQWQQLKSRYQESRQNSEATRQDRPVWFDVQTP